MLIKSMQAIPLQGASLQRTKTGGLKLDASGWRARGLRLEGWREVTRATSHSTLAALDKKITPNPD